MPCFVVLLLLALHVVLLVVLHVALHDTLHVVLHVAWVVDLTWHAALYV